MRINSCEIIDVYVNYDKDLETYGDIYRTYTERRFKNCRIRMFMRAGYRPLEEKT